MTGDRERLAAAEKRIRRVEALCEGSTTGMTSVRAIRDALAADAVEGDRPGIEFRGDYGSPAMETWARVPGEARSPKGHSRSAGRGTGLMPPLPLTSKLMLAFAFLSLLVALVFLGLEVFNAG